MTRCPTHLHQSPPAPAEPLRLGAQPYTCKGCGAQAGTEAERQKHYCQCCGTRLERCIRAGGSACPQCGPISRAGEFVAPTDYMAELLAGRQQPTEEELAASLLRSRVGEQIAHHVRWDYRMDGYMRATLTRGTVRILLRISPELRRIEAATSCRRERCGGTLWTPVATAADLLQIHQGTPGRASVCDRCGEHV